MNTVALVVLASLITALITTVGGWAVNQLPALKSHVSARVRVGLAIALTVIAGLTAAGISVASSRASAGGPDTARAPVTPTSTPASSLPASYSGAPDPQSSSAADTLSESATGKSAATTDFPPGPEPTPPPKRPSGPRSMFVADFDDSDVGSSSNSYHVGSVDLDGRTYSRSSLPTCYYDDTSTEFTLHRKWTRFSALVGIKDQAQSDYSATVTIYRDGNLWKQPLTVKVGSPEPVKIDVTGVLKLTLNCSPGAGHAGFIRLALGDALVSAPA